MISTKHLASTGEYSVFAISEKDGALLRLEEVPMLFDLIQLLSQPEQYVCNWRDTELYIEPVEVSVASVENNNQPAEETIAGNSRQRLTQPAAACLGRLP